MVHMYTFEACYGMVWRKLQMGRWIDKPHVSNDEVIGDHFEAAEQ